MSRNIAMEGGSNDEVLPVMYICICNALTERDVAAAVAEAGGRPAEVFAACRCRAQCGTCVRRILDMIRTLEPADRPGEALPQAA